MIVIVVFIGDFGKGLFGYAFGGETGWFVMTGCVHVVKIFRVVVGVGFGTVVGAMRCCFHEEAATRRGWLTSGAGRVVRVLPGRPTRF